MQLKAICSHHVFARSMMMKILLMMMMMMMRLVRVVSNGQRSEGGDPWSKFQKRKEKIMTLKQKVPQMIWGERLCGEP